MPSPLLLEPPLSVKPRLSEAEARARLPLRSPFAFFRKLPLLRSELCYLPHYLFRLTIGWESGEQKVDTAVDAVVGHFAFWQEEKLEKSPPQELTFELPFLLTPEEAETRLREQYRWVLISSGLKSREQYEIKELSLRERVYYPFWVGYFQHRGRFHFEVLDAITGTRQGGKVREAFLTAWVRAPKE